MTVPMERVEDRILTIRGHRVILDADLAEIYDVQTKALNQAIKRNAKRFPEDFMFQLSREEADSLRSQTVTIKTVRGQHRKYLPYVRQFKVVFDAIRALMDPPNTPRRRIGY